VASCYIPNIMLRCIKTVTTDQNFDGYKADQKGIVILKSVTIDASIFVHFYWRDLHYFVSLFHFRGIQKWYSFFDI